MKHLQFYLSDPIVLQHKVVDGANTQVTGGKIKVVNGEKIEEIIIPAHTPGVLVKNDDGKLEISFEKGDDHYLRFGANPNRYETFVLLASDWKGKIGTVNYAGNKYFTSPESADALLLIDMRKIANYQKDQRIAKGRKVN
jgi:myo-inositol-hexaphosphate 3-phosphohydrolase